MGEQIENSSSKRIHSSEISVDMRRELEKIGVTVGDDEVLVLSVEKQGAQDLEGGRAITEADKNVRVQATNAMQWTWREVPNAYPEVVQKLKDALELCESDMERIAIALVLKAWGELPSDKHALEQCIVTFYKVLEELRVTRGRGKFKASDLGSALLGTEWALEKCLKQLGFRVERPQSLGAAASHHVEVRESGSKSTRVKRLIRPIVLQENSLYVTAIVDLE